nr:ribosomal RNA processing protein 36 homolog [Odocoileus virginianus texanus]
MAMKAQAELKQPITCEIVSIQASQKTGFSNTNGRILNLVMPFSATPEETFLLSRNALIGASSRGGAAAGSPSRAQDGGEDDGGLQKDTSHMSFEELLELQSQVGTKGCKRLVTGSSAKKQSSRPPVPKACVADKHRPLEMSAKVRVPFLRQVVPVSKKVARDPRFDALSGEYSPEVFDKTYQFLDDIRAREKELVKKQLKKRRSGEEHEKLQQLLPRMEQQEMAQKERRRQQELRLALKQELRLALKQELRLALKQELRLALKQELRLALKQELRLALKQERRAQAQQGHRPHFLKKSEQRQLVLAEKLKELKRSKKLGSFLSRKRRRNAGRGSQLPWNSTSSEMTLSLLDCLRAEKEQLSLLPRHSSSACIGVIVLVSFSHPCLNDSDTDGKGP